ncbi:hypothetical protein CLOM_g6288 [Closterium sp. NIES-68]|nr:hypothetical protein CLOM_g6288 [Closterium sp. NIES-68]GJP74579.1 hypothetical protein CLOP_g5141 [Closterium sp. NIES-67]
MASLSSAASLNALGSLAALSSPLPNASSGAAMPVLPARRGAVRAQGGGNEGRDEGSGQGAWKPPSDWDNAWAAYKKAAPAQSQQPRQPGRSAAAGTDSSGSASSSVGGRTSSARVPPAPAPMGGLFSHMEQYVSREPQRADYPLSEEVDPLRVTEKRVLRVWTDARFTYAGFGVIVGLFVYMIAVVGPPSA